MLSRVMNLTCRVPIFPWQLTRSFTSEKPKKMPSKRETYNKMLEDELKSPFDYDAEPESYTASKSKTVFYIFTGVISLLVLGSGIWINQKGGLKFQSTQVISGIVTPQATDIGGTWRLTDSQGKQFGSKDLEGYYYMLYFGFTRCPTICPNIMYKVANTYRVIRNIPEGAFMKLKVVFVSVDPDRDTLGDIDQYVKHFHQNFIAVTGSSNKDTALIECMQKFKVFSEKIDEKGVKSYNLNHSTFVYLMGTNNEYITTINTDIQPQKNAQIIVEKVLLEEKKKGRTNQSIQ